MSFIDNRKENQVSYLSLTTSGALILPISVKQIVTSTMVYIELPTLTSTATSSNSIYLSGFIRPQNTQEDFIHVLDGTSVKIGSAILNTSGVLEIDTVAANGRPASFSNNQLAGWETLQVVSFALN